MYRYYHLSTNHRNQPRLADYMPADLYMKRPNFSQLVQQLGHRLGLSGSVLAHSFEYARFGQIRYLLSEDLRAYCQQEKSKQFDLVLDAVESYYYAAKRNVGNLLKTRLEQQKLVFIPAYFYSAHPIYHCIAIVIYKNLLVIVNRDDSGDLRKTSYATVHEINPSFYQNRSAGFFEYLTTNIFASEAALMSRLRWGMNSRRQIAYLKMSRQAHSTCMYVNPKSSIRALLMLLDLEAQGTLGSANELQCLEAYEHVADSYKKFTSFIRDRAVDRLISDMKRHHSIYLVAYFKIIYEIIKQFSVKKKHEKRLQILVETMQTIYSENQRTLDTSGHMARQLVKKAVQTYGRQLVSKYRSKNNAFAIFADDYDDNGLTLKSAIA